MGSRDVDVLLGVIDKGQGALPHAHPGIEQVCYLLSGTARAQVLAALVADVIKVESPAGDNMRAVGPIRNPGMGRLRTAVPVRCKPP